MSIIVNKAKVEDVEFIATSILRAEDTGFEITSYSKMFNKTNDELVPLVSAMLNNESDGHPLCWKSYYIASIDGAKAGAISAYVEGSFGDSSHLMTGALLSGFDRANVMSGFKFIGAHKEVQIQKTVGTLQIDCVSTAPNYEGKGVFSSLLKYVEIENVGKNIEFSEIQVWMKNQHAINVYESKGYTIFDTRESLSEQDNGKVLMRKKL